MKLILTTAPKTVTIKNKETGEVRSVTYDAVYLTLGTKKSEIKCVYKADRELFKYLVKEYCNGMADQKEEKKG